MTKRLEIHNDKTDKIELIDPKDFDEAHHTKIGEHSHVVENPLRPPARPSQVVRTKDGKVIA